MCLSQTNNDAEQMLVRIIADQPLLRERLTRAVAEAAATRVVASLSSDHNNDDRKDRRNHTLILALANENDWEKARQVIRECPKARAMLIVTDTELPHTGRPAMAVAPDKSLEQRIADALYNIALQHPDAMTNSDPIDQLELERLSLLTSREKEVLSLTATGMTLKEIARKLHRAYGTITRHRANIMIKLKLHDRVSLTRFAIRHGLTDA